MERVSTNLTLFFKFFVPIFWIVLFGSFTVAVLALNYDHYGDFRGGPFRIGTLVFYVSGVIMLLFTLLRLKRVEMDSEFIFATNYFKYARYPYHQVEKISESSFLFLKVVRVTLKTAGIFGKSFMFIASNNRYRAFWTEHPELKAALPFD
ncbi:MAG TPA: hypothetical protein PKE06_27020 [Flavilitoribacter sp.]|nr:hypothetical protein [Flavilitoribacter sp.]HMQ88342.1 hypothetical protein [Flavilitoribacter sp.]